MQGGLEVVRWVHGDAVVDDQISEVGASALILGLDVPAQ